MALLSGKTYRQTCLADARRPHQLATGGSRVGKNRVRSLDSEVLNLVAEVSDHMLQGDDDLVALR